jgi:hypothetical protein
VWQHPSCGADQVGGACLGALKAQAPQNMNRGVHFTFNSPPNLSCDLIVAVLLSMNISESPQHPGCAGTDTAAPGTLGRHQNWLDLVFQAPEQTVQH